MERSWGGGNKCYVHFLASHLQYEQASNKPPLEFSDKITAIKIELKTYLLAVFMLSETR